MAEPNQDTFATPLPEVIETERLTLRAWRLDDVDDVVAYADDKEWSRFLQFLPYPYSRSDAEEFLARQILLDRRTHASWAVTSEETVIGGINFRLDAPHRLAELGYSIARAHWNRGFCTEAAAAVVDAAFESYPDLNRVRAMADEENTASQRVMEKLGMTKEGVLRHNRYAPSGPIDEAWWGMLRAEWSGGTASPG